MSGKEKKYKIFLKSFNKFVEVDKDYFYEYYRGIWAQMKKHQRAGECVCPKSKACYCSLDCLDCEHHRFSSVSLDAPIEEGETTLGDVLEDEKDEASISLSISVSKRLSSLSQKDYEFCMGLMNCSSDADLRKAIGYTFSRQAFEEYKANKIAMLRDVFADIKSEYNL